MKLLQDKVALITGASRGIGKAIALKFASEGANIAFTDLKDDENMASLVKELEGMGVKAKGYASNAANTEETAKTVAAIAADFGRIDILGFPARSAFEGVVNAFAHRDYYLDNTQIDIDIFRDRLEITSPGSFQGGEINTKEYDLSHIISVRRNALICDVLVRLKYMEASGTGFEKIVEDYRNADHGHKPYIYSSDLQFSLILPDLTHSEGVQANSIDFNCLSETEKRDEILVKILRFCLPEKKTVGEICSMLGISNSSYFRKKRLIPMVEKGYLEESKERNRKVYKTNKDTISI